MISLVPLCRRYASCALAHAVFRGRFIFLACILQGGRFKVSRNWIQYQFALELGEGGGEGGGIEESVRTTKQPFHLADLVEGASAKLKFEAAEGIKPRVYENKRGNYVASMPRRSVRSAQSRFANLYTVNNNNMRINENDHDRLSK